MVVVVNSVVVLEELAKLVVVVDDEEEDRVDRIDELMVGATAVWQPKITQNSAINEERIPIQSLVSIS